MAANARPKVEDVLEMTRVRSADDVTPCDMRRAVEECDTSGEPWECHQLRMAGRAESVWITVFPEAGTAMLCDGAGTSVVYDAETVHDAIAEHFGE